MCSKRIKRTRFELCTWWHFRLRFYFFSRPWNISFTRSSSKVKTRLVVRRWHFCITLDKSGHLLDETFNNMTVAARDGQEAGGMSRIPDFRWPSPVIFGVLCSSPPAALTGTIRWLHLMRWIVITSSSSSCARPSLYTGSTLSHLVVTWSRVGRLPTFSQTPFRWH